MAPDPDNAKPIRPVPDGASVNAGHVAEVVAEIEDPVTIAEAVALSGLSERTIRRRISEGKLRQCRAGRKCVLSRGEVLRAAGKSAATSANAGHEAMPDSASASAGHVDNAIAPILEQLSTELGALHRQNEGLHGIVVDLNRELGEGRKLLQAGAVEQLEATREASTLREQLAKAETARVWALLIAVGAGLVGLALGWAVG